MIINASSLIIAFENYKVIESKDKIAKILEGKNKTIQTIELPDDAPSEIPRIIAHSNFGHSNIVINNQSIQISTSYDEAYGNDINKVYEYLLDKLEEVFFIVDELNVNVTFTGLSLNIQEDISDPVCFIADKFLKIKSNINAFDNSLKIVYVTENQYYVNINLDTLNIVKELPTEASDKISSAEIVGHQLGIVLDINDKYSYNQNQKYFTSKNSAQEIIEYSKNIYGTIIPELLEKGEIRL